MLSMLKLGLLYDNWVVCSLLAIQQNVGYESRFYVTIINHIPSKKILKRAQTMGAMGQY